MATKSLKISENKNIFEKNITCVLFMVIISFLSCKYTKKCKRVCKTWNNNLKSKFSKKMLALVPNNISNPETLNLSFVPYTIFKIGNYIYASCIRNVVKINTVNSEIINVNNKNFQEYFIQANNNYICVKNKNYINILSITETPIRKIPIEKCRGFAIDKHNNILISTNYKFYIYNIEGKEINSWELVNDSSFRSRKIASDGKNIFMLDTSFHCVRVFSYNGELLKSWKLEGTSSGLINGSAGISTYRDLVFITNILYQKIQAFSSFGRLMFEYIDNFHDYKDIIIVEDHFYVSTLDSPCIIRFKFLYD
jgi:hypothetical protein